MAQTESTTSPPLLNRVMTILLKSPIHGVVSKSIMLITFTGRKSGRVYTTPISYAQQNGQVVAFTNAKWSRNLQGGAPVSLHIMRKELNGTADVIAEDKEVVAGALREFLNVVRSDARFYNVKFDEDGAPNWEDVQLAAQRVVLIRITLDGEQQG